MHSRQSDPSSRQTQNSSPDSHKMPDLLAVLHLRPLHMAYLPQSHLQMVSKWYHLPSLRPFRQNHSYSQSYSEKRLMPLQFDLTMSSPGRC